MRVPKMQHFKPKNLARVRISGNDGRPRIVYLGPWGSEEARQRYEQLITVFLSRQDHPEIVAVTINRLCVAYLEHAQSYYVKDGVITSEVGGIRSALRPLVELFGRQIVADFGPLKLKQVREQMIARGWFRKTVNRNIKRIVRMLRWGVENEWVAPHILEACRELRNLQAGRCGEIPEGDAVEPVDIDRVEAVKPFVSRQVWAMIQLQLAAGMRPQEVRIIRWSDIDQISDVWCYVPRIHKMQHKNRHRRIYIGPVGQSILGEFLKADREAYIFSPRDAERERREEQRANRKTSLTPSQAARVKLAAPKRVPGAMYTKDSYNRCITRACEIAFEMPQELRSVSSKLPKREQEELKARAGAWRQEWCWTPLQLRHTAGTELRKSVDLNAARQVLGHSEKSTTEIYAEQDFDAAREIMRKFG